MKQKQFHVFKHATLGYEAVKIGWSWPACLFGVLWALVKREWAIAFGLIFLVLAMSYAPIIAALAVLLVLGAKGNDMRIMRLQNRGYQKIGEASANMPEGAVAYVVGRNDKTLN